MWNKIEHDFGNIKAGTRIEFTFEYTGEKIIRGFKASCSCITLYPKNKTLRVVWNTRKDIPESYESFKFITVTYAQEELEVLTLKCTLVK